MNQSAERVKIVEVSPRDGLQNERTAVATGEKLQFINMLLAAGLSTVEITSCVPARWVPQLADHREVIAGVSPEPGVCLPVLVPNMKGFEDALSAGARAVSVIASASESFAQKNSNCSIDQGLQRCAEILEQARHHDLTVRGYVSCTLGCPYEGEINLVDVIRVTEKLYSLGCPEIALSDTIGVGTPARVREMLRSITASVPVSFLAVHFHDTYGQALANIFAALEEGVRIIDSSVAGLGGCPYAHGASGNVASEDLVYMLNGIGAVTGIDLEKLVQAGEFICRILGRENGSKVAQAIGVRTRD